MDDLFAILRAVNQTPDANQRELAAGLAMSVGKVNSLLHSAEEEGYLLSERDGKRGRLSLTDRGRRALEDALLDRQQMKLSLPGEDAPVRTAVILAAGRREDFDTPAALLPLGEQTVLDRAIRVLEDCGIQQFYVVGGFGFDGLKEHLAGRKNVVLLENPRYKWTGTMYGLSLLSGKLDGGFLLLTSDLVCAQKGVAALLEEKSPFSALLAAPSGHGDESFVELDRQGSVFRISKDIHQINRIQGEMTGIVKLSGGVYRMMLEYFSGNENPYLNYEYVLENIGRIYPFRGVMVDDLVWTKVETAGQYQALVNILYPRIERKETQMREKLAADTLVEVMGVSPEDILEISFAGGMTNTNYYVELKNGRYILRLPGRMTESLINRQNEERNARLASDLGFNCRLVYCNAATGVKVSEYIDGAETLNPRTTRLEGNIRLIADILRRVHRSDMVLENRFDPFEESLRYEELLKGENARMYKGYDQLKVQVMALYQRLRDMGYDQLPCHNDLVAANLVKDKNGRLYLIDWEYSGVNDPMCDVAALFLENDFTPEDEELFFHYYFGEDGVPAAVREKILIFKISLDFLWSIWTVLKEAKGDDFGSYGLDRFRRAQALCTEYWEIYGK